MTVVKDATREQMLVALDRMHDQVKGNDSLLICYAGHGFQDKGFGGKGFWIPVDGISPLATEKSPRGPAGFPTVGYMTFCTPAAPSIYC